MPRHYFLAESSSRNLEPNAKLHPNPFCTYPSVEQAYTVAAKLIRERKVKSRFLLVCFQNCEPLSPINIDQASVELRLPV